MTAPERIYLQGAADAPDCEDPNSGVTWCWHQIDDTDVEYVRTDLAARATAEQLDTCRHRIVDARNPIITSGYFCLDCGAVFGAGDHAGLPKSKQSRDSVIEECAAICDKAEVAYNVAVRKETASFLALMIRTLKSQQDAAVESKPAEQSAFSGVDSAYQDWHRENYFGRIAAPKYVEIWRAACSWQAKRQNSVIQSLRNALGLMMDVGFQHLPANERARRYDIADAAIESQRSGDGS